jgi:anti-sigma regulatory factor (Ser/Thr protein kinase)
VDVSEDCPTVQLRLDSRPETLTLVRGVLGGVAELLALDLELLDDLKTAVSEACNNVVMHAYDGAAGPLEVFLYVNPGAIEVVVRDEGTGIPDQALSNDRMQGVGVPIIRALAQEAEFRSRREGGTEVWMAFSGQRDGAALFQHAEDPAPDDGWVRRLSGDAVVSLSPVSFLGGVLGRLARALAARARFSLDRFSDVYLVTDAVAAHASRAAKSGRIGFGISTQPRRLELTLGPLRTGASTQLTEDPRSGGAGSALTMLSDELTISPVNGAEVLRVVLLDEPRSS